MSRTIVISEAERDLRGILHSLEQGESATLVDEESQPLATLVSLRSAPASGNGDSKESAMAKWAEEMEQFSKEVDEAWIGDKSGVETLSEMRGRLD